MFITRYITSSALCFAMAISLPAVAQNATPITWSQDLTFLQKLTPSEMTVQQGAVAKIRHEVETWIATHPNQEIKLSAAPAQPWTSEQTQIQINELTKAVTVLAANEAHPFHLGQTEVVVNGSVSPLSPVAVSVGQEQFRATNTVKVTDAIDQLPGIEINHNSGQRNEASYYLRGFSNKQAPLYLDGIPIYVPYDGYIDLNRFVVSDLAEVQISRGYTSALLGPNAMAGSVNLVTREPYKPYEADLAIGTGSGNQLISSAHLGRRSDKYFLQTGLDWAQRDYIPLPGSFKWPSTGYTAYTGIKQFTNEEPNTDSRDERYSARIGWTPKPSDEYVFSYANQKGKKDGMVYLGLNAAQTGNAWLWPYWDKTSYYFLSNTNLGDKNSIKTRVFYDQFANSIDMYDNFNYNTMTGSKSAHSHYDDHTDGASIVFHTDAIPHHSIGVSAYFKDDTHHEWQISQPQAAHPLDYPWKTLRDQQTSFGVEDLVTITSRLHVTGGFSVDHINGLMAQAYTSGYTNYTYGIVGFTCVDNPTNTSVSGCTPHYSSYNPQVAATYMLTNSDTVYATFSHRGRFPVMKELFSSTFGTTIPNPNLKSEHASNWNIGYTHVFNDRLNTDIQLFRSNLSDAIVSGTVYTASTGLCTNIYSTTGGVTTYSCSFSWNAGHSVNEGIEAKVNARPLNRLRITADYSFLNRHINASDAVPDGALNSLFSNYTTPGNLSAYTGIPKHKIQGIATIMGPRDIIGTIRERYQGSTLMYDASAASKAVHGSSGYWASAAAITDVGVSVPIRAGVKLDVGVNNLLDRNYFFTAGYPEAGRNWYFNMRYQF